MFRKSSCPGCSFAQGQSVPSDREKTGFEAKKIHAGHEIEPRFHELASISSLARVETFRLQGMFRAFSCPGDEILLSGPLPRFFNAQGLEI